MFGFGYHLSFEKLVKLHQKLTVKYGSFATIKWKKIDVQDQINIKQLFVDAQYFKKHRALGEDDERKIEKIITDTALVLQRA